MATRTLPHEAWADFVDAVARDAGRADHVILRRAPPNHEAPPESRRLRFLGLTYDPRADLFEVTAHGLRHFVHHPSAVRVDETQGRLRRLTFVFPNGAREAVEFLGRRP